MMVIPSLWVCFSIIDVPLYGYVLQSSTHTSGHRYVKSSPWDINLIAVEPQLATTVFRRVVHYQGRFCPEPVIFFPGLN